MKLQERTGKGKNSRPKYRLDALLADAPTPTVIEGGYVEYRTVGHADAPQPPPRPARGQYRSVAGMIGRKF